VIVTRNRREQLEQTLDRLTKLPEQPAIVVVDNGSRDGTVAAVRSRPEAVRVVGLAGNRGSAARNVGAELAQTPYVAFSDDDSWWQPGALARAERLLDADARIALLAARVLVEPERRLDPTCVAMATSPLDGDARLPGPRVLGFLACGAIVRRAAFLAVGGFHARLGIGGEEALLALDLAEAGYELVYADDVVAHHQPDRRRRPGRARITVRNELLVTWLRWPLPGALRRTGRLLVAQGRDRQAALGAIDALRAAPWVLRERQPVGARLERGLRTLDRAG
jgi:N-acetylglucosaminyl-diphospho-decaprenol L-rhamnosyltransferase